MAAREYVEWMAYQAIENAAVHHQEHYINRRSQTTLTSSANQHSSKNMVAGLSKSSSSAAGFQASEVNDELAGDVHRRMHISQTCSNLQNGVESEAVNHNANNYGVMSHMKKRLSDNFEHYSNVFHGVALPILFGQRARSRSRSRDKKQNSRTDQNSNAQNLLSRDQHDTDDFEIVENIELHHMDGFVFSSQRETGKGHHFILVHLRSPSWCDKCGDFIWGVSKQCLKCTNCEYTCHHKCRQNVALDCAGSAVEPKIGERASRKRTETSLSSGDASQAMICSSSTVWFFKRSPSRRTWLLDLWGSRANTKEDDADSGYHTGSSTLQSRAQRGARRPPGEYTLTREDLRRNIERFNNNNHGLIMSLQADNNTFQGFIRVHMNLIRPINMSLSSRPPSIYDALGKDELVEDVELNDVNQITSFYLPKDTTKVIHINSDTTTQEVIQVLLSKFKITDNPRKFALYEKSEEDDKAVMRRLEDDEVPLPLCLCWTKDGVTGLDRRKFVLQENDTGEIMWEAFSLPELENFLKILNREEEEYVEQVRGKYRMLKIHMERRLKELCPGETSLTGDKRNPVFV